MLGVVSYGTSDYITTRVPANEAVITFRVTRSATASQYLHTNDVADTAQFYFSVSYSVA